MTHMKSQYNPKEIEPKWQRTWKDTHAYAVGPSAVQNSTDTYYSLGMFPYPSGAGLHVGHVAVYTASDIAARYRRMTGKTVLHPIGFDAFGLPAENYAIKTGVHPSESTATNAANFTRQIESLGISYDWDRAVNTSTPEYYRWTQWIFLKLYENNLVERRTATVNWCDTCQTALANAQVIDGKCERSKDEVSLKEMDQWFFKTSQYSGELLDSLDDIDWPPFLKTVQRNWIGKSEGVHYECRIKGTDYTFEVYDSVPQTYMAQTFAVIAPEHPILQELIPGTEYEEDVMACIKRIQDRKLVGTEENEKEIDGAFTGLYIEDPYGTGDLPLWVASFAIYEYGSGIVNCSAHDERDFAFAKQFGIDLRPVMFPEDPEEAQKVRDLEYCYHHADDGVLVAPEVFAGRKWGEVRDDVINHLEQEGIGKRGTNYKLRDWVISRQRYWGAPIPMVYDPEGNPHPVKEEHLPLLLPTDVDYEPKGTSPLGSSEEYAKRAEEYYGEGWRFEVDTMDTFVCSSWYYLRYCDPHNTEVLAAPEKMKEWLPVNVYTGGAEHAVLHLIYARFMHKALIDCGVIPAEVGREPFASFKNTGHILGEDNQKMSKSIGNVINPDDVVAEFGADTLRVYGMFMGPYGDSKPWSTESIKGARRFLDKVWNLQEKATAEEATKEELQLLHKTIKKVTDDIETFGFNTAISQMMTCVKGWMKQDAITKESYATLVQLLFPYAPHMASELLEEIGESARKDVWPSYDEQYLVQDTVTMAVQVNGKVRSQISLAPDASEDEARNAALADENVQAHTEGKEIVKFIYVPGRIVNIVAK